MAMKDLLLALVVIVAWGVNFVVIKLGLHGVPPMLLGALRFALAALPAVFFVPRPRIPLRMLVLYGATILLAQFVFLFTAMNVGMPAGVASLVLQAQAFFTLGFARLFLGERVRAWNLAGLAIAALGLVTIAARSGGAMTLAGFALTLCAAASWALGNIVTKRIGKVELVPLVVWGSLVPPLPFLALSFALEGPARIEAALGALSGASVFAIVYLAWVATLVGYALWGRLLSRYPAAQVAPLSLVVPVVGIASSALLLGERMSGAEYLGTALVMAGLVVNVFGGRLVRRTA
ncbi:EamA family transporter [Burkholderia glumae]|uniref:EamA family transporter n=1 Tax=Burkholderia glumae TaxID=337 RepID=A0AAP9Y703_BURGL|nr:EamA family transporter [Burkholderia glumae]AJY67284.1 eamA-like transporter family protein [Burkholderia glumae LMG 2196 = ATCC 33617]MCM2482365.1 EamA family transporter [Burkholderia glumae]MCM2491028.1 EamA family transporter [Burkholderia glumae]MCM2507491.1 EamA family transporter [Burkholderia glumae]MCM2539177.1 EamA family transporter [Burkholderia glumae]